MRKHILIVDDEQEFVQMLKLRLESSGYAVETALNADECLKKAKQTAPDLIIIDIVMPGMSGGELAGLLKKDPKINKTPLIFLTAMLRKREEESNMTIHIGNETYPAITKPFDPIKLLKTIQEQLAPNYKL